MPGPAASSAPKSIAKTEIERLRTQTAAFVAAARPAGDADILIEVGQPAIRILERAASLPADLIVMGTYTARAVSSTSYWVRSLRKCCGKLPVRCTTVPPRVQAPSRLPFQRVLCAVDCSDSSLGALQDAFSLAEESGAVLTVLHVLEWPWEEPPPPRLEELPFEQAAALAEYRRYCETTATARLESLVPDSARALRSPVIRLRSGKPYVQILDVAAEEHSDLIIVGVRGRKPLDVTLFGSTTNQLVRRARCPVLTLRR